MVKEFKSYIEDNQIFHKDDTILLAVSGGIDSMVLTDLFIKSGYKFAIAHCNFHLREEESNTDAQFVTNFAQANNLTLHYIEFDTFTYMKEKSISLEMAARELRYKWFYQLLDDNNYTYLATGHHGDDSIETFFINLLRGTGIAGLHGILQKVNRLIHPLLFTNRKEIIDYQQKNKLQYVEDSTNATTKYTRNKIRHELIPLLKEISPNFQKTILKEIERFKETEEVFRTLINKAKQELITKQNNHLKISIEKIKNLKPINIYLYEILSEYNFNESTINSIKESLDDTPGKQFYSETHRLVKDREYLLITPNIKQGITEYKIDLGQTFVTVPINLQIEVLTDLSFIKIPKTKDIAMLDYDKLVFPLILRKWKNGDSFYPYGMKSEKKISTYYKDLKYSLLDKESQWLLCSDNNIVWVVGQRIDERYKITNKTNTIYRLELDE
ncbi:MAG: tRNA lysidine(34) synthetase TilS [Bacteroidales bacterium]|jgi:tRNA(Ile)-lysidine synthase|nr:tRNA lysidine(34) synthetase TilS [Bacteroidales bacterium]MDD4001584.1 tRNA lysidine(34) synthetase TilS [Bacteroidales bacterium]MDD4528259.1 tRNA lysidine(34) synthetase TilS [Bacteroidales bacterium]MDD4830102.1 tRNA lysidine(34) synthetase TilS [Bacteroidales bacterium]